MRLRGERDAYQGWLAGQVLLLGLLGAGLALFVARPELPTAYHLPELRLVIRTTIALGAAAVAVLAAIRFSVEGHRLDLLLACGFSIAGAETLGFAIAPVLGGAEVGPSEEWADVFGRLLGGAVVAASPFVRGRVTARSRALRISLVASASLLAAAWALLAWLGPSLPALPPGAHADPPPLLTVALGVQAVLDLLALVGFGVRYRKLGEDLDRWLALGATFLLFSSLHLVFAPLVPPTDVTQGDFARILGYTLLLVGVWRAIRTAEFGRAVAEERARVAREIHDGLAQYLFAISAQASMLESGAPQDAIVPRLKQAAAAAQQEARFAVLALSSASGTAPFDAALRRYVELLTADGALDVELEIDPATRLAPDEQIEVFRIVQEGLANARRHAGARRAEVRIGSRSGRRMVVVRDDGSGFEETEKRGGQGLANIRARAASIGGAFTLRSHPGLGTALEVTLRA